MNTNNFSATPKAIHTHAIHPGAGKDFRSVAASSAYLKPRKKRILLQCTHCQMTLKNPRKCSKCKSVWYCSQKCQKKNWPTHKLTCHETDRSSGSLKFIRMFISNPLIMGYLKIGIIFDCGLLDKPGIGFDVPFVARVDIGIEPSDILDFIGLYLDDKAIGEKLQGMVQVNAVTPRYPSLMRPLTPQQLHLWREARAMYNAKGFAKDPVGLVDFVDGSCPGYWKNGVTVGLHIPTIVLDMARKREPFVHVSAVTGTRFKQPMNAVACLEYINAHIREDTQNQLRLRTEMTDKDKEIIRAAGRNEGTFSARILKEKMEREHLYANIPGPHRREGLGIKISLSRRYSTYCWLPFVFVVLFLSLLPMLPLLVHV
ncbi:hypothetical protein DEU56DRAFT_977093 [Suillus clintonianus]|uniref:uncharacterized protein n=1 Tax=Suillus clintonianus TaxID=1904413 RepID=UPI001B86898D|nr:uncharacterized protein DEU56DRAFT_977093 [Suillus clintonianus]KAG2153415.1 hypothetical protein DEU56DRAFT_977093 [Suillus clintonianus]